MALALACLGSKQMLLARVTPFQLSLRGHAEAFLGPLVRFHFRHGVPSICGRAVGIWPRPVQPKAKRPLPPARVLCRPNPPVLMGRLYCTKTGRPGEAKTSGGRNALTRSASEGSLFSARPSLALRVGISRFALSSRIWAPA